MIEYVSIPDFDGYYIAKCGTIIGKHGQKLSQWDHRKGDGKKPYKRVEMWHKNKRRRAYVHTLVLTTFVGPRPSTSYMCCHRDDNSYNNHLDNLYWGTMCDNAADHKRNGKVVPISVD